MAAQEMNGKEIKGRKVKTKGPSVQQRRDSLTSSASKPKTVELIDSDKFITDCYYFILNGICKPKAGTVCLSAYIYIIYNFLPKKQTANKVLYVINLYF